MTIERLEELEKAATAGPWEQHGDGSCRCGYIYGDGGNVYVAKSLGLYDDVDPVATDNRNNAAFIVATRNALPALLAVAKAAKAYVDQWPNASAAHANLVFAVAELEAQ